jgi:Transposase C of IS166 homeodomain
MVAAPPALPDLNALDPDAMKALAVAQNETLVSHQTEIENLKLQILKLPRLQFGRKSEKLDRQIELRELRLEDLKSAQLWEFEARCEGFTDDD